MITKSDDVDGSVDSDNILKYSIIYEIRDAKYIEEKKTQLLYVNTQIKEKKINSIMYLSSQMNIIIENLVHKLGLKIENHLQPYPLDWVDNDTKS